MTLSVALPALAAAQEPAATSRTAAIEQEQAEKEKSLHPYVATRGEKAVTSLGDILAGSGGLSWYPYFESAYSGGGFAFGAGYRRFVSPYNTIDLRGSYSVSGYKRAEVELTAPRLFTRRGKLSVLAGWRGGDAGRFLRHRNRLGEGRPYELRLPAAVRLGHARGQTDTPPLDIRRRPRAHAVVAEARPGRVPVG